MTNRERSPMDNELAEVDPTLTDHQRIRLLEVSQRMLIAQQSEVTVAMRDVKDCLRKGDSRMGAMESELTNNSKVTVEVRDILSAAKGAFKVFGWLGGAVKWTAAVGGSLTALYVAAYTATHGRPPWP